MTKIASAQDLENHIGYTFHDSKILEEARTRRSFTNEKPAETEEFMDPLATLGDAILDAIVIFKLYEDGERDPGKLTENKIHNVKRKKTRAFAEKNDLGKYIRWGKGEGRDEIWNKGDRALDAVTEALIGAIYLDAQRNEMNGMAIVLEILEKKNFFKTD